MFANECLRSTDVGGAADTVRMDTRLPKIDDILSTVFLEARSLSTGVKHRRTLQVEREVRAFIEAETVPYLTDDELTLLAAEQEFEPSGAACRVLGAEVLIVALVGFIKPPYLAPDLLLRRVQLDLVDALVRYAAYDVLRGQDVGSIRREYRSAMWHARDRLKRDRQEQSWAREAAKMDPGRRQALELALQDIDVRFGPKHAAESAPPATESEPEGRGPRPD